MSGQLSLPEGERHGVAGDVGGRHGAKAWRMDASNISCCVGCPKRRRTTWLLKKGGSRAGARLGGSARSPRARRASRISSASVTSWRRVRRPPQSGHISTAMAKVRFMSSAHGHETRGVAVREYVSLAVTAHADIAHHAYVDVAVAWDPVMIHTKHGCRDACTSSSSQTEAFMPGDTLAREPGICATIGSRTKSEAKKINQGGGGQKWT